MKQRGTKDPIPESRWKTPSAEISVDDGDVHVWCARLDRCAEELDHLSAALSPDERSRAASFYSSRHRYRFIAARGILRNILARYLRHRAHELRFSYGPFGKPSLEGETNDIRFNLSHADDLALYAVTRGADVGIDLERIRPELVLDAGMAKTFFPSREWSRLDALPPKSRVEFFFMNWTATEAYVKACGDGFSQSTPWFDFSSGSADEIPILPNKSDAPWFLYRCNPNTRYAGALVSEKRCRRLRWWLWGLKRVCDFPGSFACSDDICEELAN